MDAGVRVVVFDCETTGLDPVRDRIISIGAVGVRDGEICLAETFEALVPMAFATASEEVHGITPARAAEGVPEVQAVAGFLEFVGDAVLVGHHVGFDLAMVRRVAESGLGRSLVNRAVDTMTLALALEAAGGLPGFEPSGGHDLDRLCAWFGIVAHDRHTASGDAFLTAQLFLRLRAAALRAGWEMETIVAAGSIVP